MFSKILIANRGEIAVRIIRACREMGISTVAIYSEADKDALHVSLADEAYCVGPAQVGDSYLNMLNILTIAVSSGAQAIHPGYGLLSENAKFVSLCEKCNITFIGPSSQMIEDLGDKDKARKTMQKAGVPVTPGTEVIEDENEAKAAAGKIGYPILIKARSGGGGRGIRLVEKEEDFLNAFRSASSEAKSAFGDSGCSVQRKNQKLIEESPSPSITPKIRAKMMDAATKAAKAVNYNSVGTVEFLLDKNKNFYFMEMNTRLQVEHGVTEMVTGLDLVQWQIRVAAGCKLDKTQDQIFFHGHAIECRINAENPDKDFRPSCGKITKLHIPGGSFVRFDTAIYQDYVIPPFYDSMVGKVIVQGRTRDLAIRKMKMALSELSISGIDHNRNLQIEILSAKEFIDGSYTTDFIEEFEKRRKK